MGTTYSIWICNGLVMFTKLFMYYPAALSQSFTPCFMKADMNYSWILWAKSKLRIPPWFSLQNSSHALAVLMCVKLLANDRRPGSPISHPIPSLP